MSGLVIGTAAYASGQLAALGIHRTAIDGDASALGIILVATQGSRIVAACDVDSDAADGERSYAVGTDARLAAVAAVDDQRAKSIDGQAVAFAQFDAFLGGVSDALAKVQHDVAADGDALVDILIAIQYIFTCCQSSRCAGYRSTVCQDDVKGLCSDVTVAVCCNGHGVLALLLHGGRADSAGVVSPLREYRAVGSSDGWYDVHDMARVLIKILHTADRTVHVVFIAIGSRYRFVDFVVGSNGIDLRALRAYGCSLVAPLHRQHAAAPHYVEVMGTLAVLHDVEAVGDATGAAVAPADKYTCVVVGIGYQAAEDAAADVDVTVSGVA